MSHASIAARAQAAGIMVTESAVADIARWLGEESFTPFTGFIPGDGDDDRVTPSRSNPIRQQSHEGSKQRHGEIRGVVGLVHHGKGE